MRARAPAPQCGSARKSTLPRHLGASSPSGNVRGGCRGWTPWAGRTTSDKNDTRLNIEFAFYSDCFFLRRSLTEPRFRPFNFKKNPPAKKKHGEAERGRGRHGEGTPEPWAAFRTTAEIGAYERVPSHHALGACEVSRSAT